MGELVERVGKQQWMDCWESREGPIRLATRGLWKSKSEGKRVERTKVHWHQTKLCFVYWLHHQVVL